MTARNNSLSKEEREEMFKKFIGARQWVFAKTYATFCPHEYVIKQWLDSEGQAEFVEIAKFIKENGWEAVYGTTKAVRKYYTIGDYYYWNMDEPELTNVLNRAKFDDFIIEETLVGKHIKSRWKGGKKIL